MNGKVYNSIGLSGIRWDTNYQIRFVFYGVRQAGECKTRASGHTDSYNCAVVYAVISNNTLGRWKTVQHTHLQK